MKTRTRIAALLIMVLVVTGCSNTVVRTQTKDGFRTIIKQDGEVIYDEILPYELTDEEVRDIREEYRQSKVSKEKESDKSKDETKDKSGSSSHTRKDKVEQNEQNEITLYDDDDLFLLDDDDYGMEGYLGNDLPYGSKEYIIGDEWWSTYSPSYFNLTVDEKKDLAAWTPDRLAPVIKQLVAEMCYDRDNSFLSEVSQQIEPVLLCGTLVKPDWTVTYRYELDANIMSIIGEVTGYTEVYDLWPESNPNKNAPIQWNSIDELCGLFGVTYRQYNSSEFQHGNLDQNSYYSLAEFTGDRYSVEPVTTLESYGFDDLVHPDNYTAIIELRGTYGEATGEKYLVGFPNASMTWPTWCPSVTLDPVYKGFPFKDIFVDYVYLLNQCDSGLTYVKNVKGLNYNDCPGIVLNLNKATDKDMNEAAEYLLSNINYDWISWMDSHHIEYQHAIDQLSYDAYMNSVLHKYFVGE